MINIFDLIILNVNDLYLSLILLKQSLWTCFFFIEWQNLAVVKALIRLNVSENLDTVSITT